MSDERILEGGCLCGAVRFRATGAAINVRCCHCRLCQRAMSAPYFARALYGPEQVAITGEPSRHPTSEFSWRGFCVTCGTRLFSERIHTGHFGLALAAFDDQGALPPDCHFFVASKAPWLVIGDGLPQYAEWPPD